jgi:hypothetical protein
MDVARLLALVDAAFGVAREQPAAIVQQHELHGVAVAKGHSTGGLCGQHCLKVLSHAEAAALPQRQVQVQAAPAGTRAVCVAEAAQGKHSVCED